MERGDSPTTLLTLEDVLGWVRERDEARSEQARLATRIASLEDRLRLASMLMAPDKAAQIIGPLSAPTPAEKGAPARAAAPLVKPHKPGSIIGGISNLLAGEKGGRAPVWIRDRLYTDPELRDKVSSHSVSNSLSRMVDRKILVRSNGLYYLPALLAAIERGDVVEEHDGNVPSSFTSLLATIVETLDGWFKPADLRAAAMEYPELRDKVTRNPNAVNSWVVRRFELGKLIREGGRYRLPSNENEAPNSTAAGASDAEEGATSSNSGRGDFNDLLG